MLQDLDTATSLSIPTAPEARPTQFFGTRIKKDLYDEVRAEQTRRGLTFRQVVEWSFVAFLRRASQSGAPTEVASRDAVCAGREVNLM